MTYPTLTPRRRENLAKLADYLESLSKRYKHFDMYRFVAFFEGMPSEYAKKNGGLATYGCGAVACAVGHGPAAGILFKPSEFELGWPSAGPDWVKYSINNFVGKDPVQNGERDITHNVLFNWMFGEDWREIDNHHYGAAARIRFILAGNKVPEVRKDEYTGRMRYDPKRRHVALYKEFRKA